MIKKINNFEYQEYEILDKEEIAPETFLFKLKDNIPFKPGQFVQVAIDHFGEATFAICSSPHEKEYFELCIRNSGNTSGHLTTLLPGDKMKIRGPYGNGWPIEKLFGKEIVLIAGGLGLVPLRPLIFALEKRKVKLGTIKIFAGFKSPEQVVFKQDLRNWIKKYHADVVVEYTEKNFWGEKGMITEALEKRKLNPSRSIVLICGPEIMCPYCNAVLFKKGIGKDQIYISLERRMECGIGICQHCNCGKHLVCQDGPIFRLDKIEKEIGK
jgi:NAD(P)H-flavin reductase